MLLLLQAIVPHDVQQLLPAAAAAAMHGLQLLAPAVAAGVDVGCCGEAMEAVGVLVHIQHAFVSKPFPDEDLPGQLALVAGPGARIRRPASA